MIDHEYSLYSSVAYTVFKFIENKNNFIYLSSFIIKLKIINYFMIL